MGTKYPGNSISGYNATPPADDGTVSEANKVKWATIKTKITDPVKTLAEAMETDLNSHFDRGPTALTTNTTLGASHFNDIIQVSGAGVTLTLSDAATLGAGWFCDIYNTDSSNNVTLALATASDTIDTVSASTTIYSLQDIRVFVNAAATGFITNKNDFDREGSDVAAAGSIDIWGIGQTKHVTGADTISSFGTAPHVGATKRLIFDGASTLQHSANLNLLGGADFTVSSGDMAFVYADTTTQHDVLFFSGVPKYPFRGCLVKRTTFQVIPDTTATILTFDAEEYDTSSIHDTSTNNSRLTVPSGITRVRLTGNVGFDTNTTGDRNLELLKNGAASAQGLSVIRVGASAGYDALCLSSPVLTVTSGDYFELRVRQTSGGSLNTVNLETFFAMELIE